MCKLIIPKKVHNKYLYFLTKFKKLEWSGPAWYKVKTDKDGYPEEWKIIHFHPLNLGSAASTEFESDDMAKILRKTFEDYPATKKAHIGLIHSHNTMGAFLSSTDESTVEDMAPDEGFYGSLVVASSGKATEAFGFGYKDQYKVPHCVVMDEDNIEIKSWVQIPEEWKEIADKIKANKTPVSTEVKTYAGTQVYNGHNNWVEQHRPNYNQTRLFDDEKITSAQQQKIDTIVELHFEGKITDIDAENKLCKLGLDALTAMKILYPYDPYQTGYMV